MDNQIKGREKEAATRDEARRASGKGGEEQQKRVSQDDNEESAERTEKGAGGRRAEECSGEISWRKKKEHFLLSFLPRTLTVTHSSLLFVFILSLLSHSTLKQTIRRDDEFLHKHVHTHAHIWIQLQRRLN